MSDLDSSNLHETAGAPAPAADLDHSLTDDIRALFDDGKTYVEAELQYQKSRAAFIADRGRSGAIYGVGALLLLHLALITLAIGTVYALAPAIGRWGATGAVVGVLIIAAVVLGLAAKKRFVSLSTALGGGGK